jgi:hypothetical protein
LPIEVRASPVHGRGVYAVRRLPRGTCIGHYEGRRYSEAALLEVDWRRRHRGMTYLFSLSDGTTIDGGEGGNATRFVNHACQPNVHAEEVTDAQGALGVRLVTSKAIPAGAELFLDYALTIDPSESPADYPCRCGLPACRRTMVAAAA